MLEFVIVHHSGVDEPHFDLMFESSPGSMLTTWRSEQWPIDKPAALVRIGDHRRDYLDYEGPVSNDRGQVKQVARGRCAIERDENGLFWSIRFEDPTMPPLNIKHVTADQWLGVPSCGGA